MNLIQDIYFETEDRKAEYLEKHAQKGITVEVTDNIVLSPELLTGELKTGLSFFTDQCGYMSYDDVNAFDALVMSRLYDLLELYAKHDHVGALQAAAMMIELLEDIDTNDDWFPQYHLENIRSCVQK